MLLVFFVKTQFLVQSFVQFLVQFFQSFVQLADWASQELVV